MCLKDDRRRQHPDIPRYSCRFHAMKRASATRAGCDRSGGGAAGDAVPPRDRGRSRRSATSGPTSSHRRKRRGHRRRRHPGDAERQRQGHGPVFIAATSPIPWTQRCCTPSMMCDRRRLARRARPHAVPDNVTLALLPPYSPERQPRRAGLALPTPNAESYRSVVLDDTEAMHRRLLPSMDRTSIARTWIVCVTLCAYPMRVMKVIS